MRTGKSAVLKWSAVAVIALVAIVGAFYIDTHSQDVNRQVSFATSRQPERFTELYFSDASKIPAAAKAGQTMPVSFVIKNAEQQATDYRYAITFTDARGMVELHAQDIRIESDEAKTVLHDIVVPPGEGRGKVSVMLKSKNQSVHFWVERT